VSSHCSVAEASICLWEGEARRSARRDDENGELLFLRLWRKEVTQGVKKSGERVVDEEGVGSLTIEEGNSVLKNGER